MCFKKQKKTVKDFRSITVNEYDTLHDLSPAEKSKRAKTRATNQNSSDYSQYPPNISKSSKYTWYNFLPLALAFQFTKLTNIYFCGMVILFLIPSVSPFTVQSVVTPFAFIISVSLIREGVEDLNRHRSDWQSNRSWTRVYQKGKAEPKHWNEVIVGDLIILRKNERIPADLVLLATSSSDGVAYLETSTLDGEKHLKPRNAPKETHLCVKSEMVFNQKLPKSKKLEKGFCSLDLNFKVQAEIPNPSLNKFNGFIEIDNEYMYASALRGQGSNQIEPVSLENEKSPGKDSMQGLRPDENNFSFQNRGEAYLPNGGEVNDTQLVSGDERSLGADKNQKNQKKVLKDSPNGSPPPQNPGYRNLQVSPQESPNRSKIPLNKIVPLKSGEIQASAKSKSSKKLVPLTNKNFLFKGTKIRNIDWIVAVVVYTGPETKIQLNSSVPKSKTSNLEFKMQMLILVMFVLQIVFALLSLLGRDSIHLIYGKKWDKFFSEHQNVDEDGGPLKTFLRYFILLNTMIPISLVVSIEFLRVFQAGFIARNLELTNQKRGIPCKVSTSTVNEELGSIQYVLSDKTGTLTKNKMELRAICVGEKIYGGNLDFNDKGLAFKSLDGSSSICTPMSPMKHFERSIRPLGFQPSPGQSEKGVFDSRLSEIMSEGSAKIKLPQPQVMRGNFQLNLLKRIKEVESDQEEEYGIEDNRQVMTQQQRSNRVFTFDQNSPNGRKMPRRENDDLAKTSKNNRNGNKFQSESDQILGNNHSKNDPLLRKKSRDMRVGKSMNLGPRKSNGNLNSNGKGKQSTAMASNMEEGLSASRKAGGGSNEKNDSDMFGAEQSGGRGQMGNFSMNSRINRPEYRGSMEPSPIVTPVNKNGVKNPKSTYQPSLKDERDIESRETLSRAGEAAEDIIFTSYTELVKEFLLCGSLCHEVLVESEDGNKKYQSSSPDEVAICQRLKEIGVEFLGTNMSVSSVKFFTERMKYDVKMTFEFDSDRKRQSVVVFDGEQYKLYIKGADSSIFPNLKQNITHPYHEVIKDNIEYFSILGFRTLVFAVRYLSTEEYRYYKEKYNKAMKSLNRKEQMNDLAIEIETQLILLGATAVEDSLQFEVKETISRLLEAKIKVWMITGDKLETADNIGLMAGIVTQSMKRFTLKNITKENVRLKISELKNRIMKLDRKETTAVIFDMSQLEFVFAYDEKYAEELEMLASVVMEADAVICARATPKQKAKIVKFVRSRNKICLAIGDGANDVNMIGQANIGVGLYGEEGLQAVQSSDFALANFRYLWKLILIHGRWNNLRMGRFIRMFFYKNMLYTFPQFIFGFYSYFSGHTLFDEWYVSMYNLLFTAISICEYGIADKDINYHKIVSKRKVVNFRSKGLGSNLGLMNDDERRTITDEKDEMYTGCLQVRVNKHIKRNFHHYYYVSKNNLIFNGKIISKEIALSIVQGVILAVLNMHCLRNVVYGKEGYTSDHWSVSISTYTSIVLAYNLLIFMRTRYITWITIAFIVFASIGPYFGFVLVYDKMESFNLYSLNSARMILSNHQFYLTVLLNMVLIMMVEMVNLMRWYDWRPSLVEYTRAAVKEGIIDYDGVLAEEVIRRIKANHSKLISYGEEDAGGGDGAEEGYGDEIGDVDESNVIRAVRMEPGGEDDGDVGVNQAFEQREDDDGGLDMESSHLVVERLSVSDASGRE